MLYFEDDDPTPKWLGFLPVDNMDDVLNTIAQNMGEVDEGDEYTTIVNDDGQEIMIKEIEGYAYLSDDPDMFDNIPADPAQMLEELPNRYNLAAKVFGQRIPEELREEAIRLIRDGYEAQLDQLADADEDELQAELREKNFEVQMEQIRGMVHETESLTVGMAADDESESLYFDMEMFGLEGSDFAKRCAATSSADPSRFGGFVTPDSAFNMNMCFKLMKQDIDQYNDALDQVLEQGIKEFGEGEKLSVSQQKLAVKSLRDIVAVVKDTISEGTVDGGVMIVAEPGNINFAMGMLAADPGKIEETVRDIVAELEKELTVDQMTANLDSDEYKGVKLHELIITVPDDEEEARDMLGDSVSVIVGIGSGEIYLAGGNNPLPLLKKAMDDSETAAMDKAIPMQWNLYVEQILRFASSMEGEPMVEDMADKLAEVGKDRISIVLNTTETGMKMRFDIQDGLLKVIGVAAENFGAGGFQPDDDDFQPQP